MSLWNFVGGAADSILDKRKRDMAAQLQKDLEEQRRNFQMTLEQQRAERDASRDERQAETDMLNRMREDERYATNRADRQEELKANQKYREDQQAAAAAERAANAAERGLAARAREEDAALRRFTAGVIKDEEGNFKFDPSRPAPSMEFKAADVVSLAKSISEVNDPAVRQEAQNAMDVGDYAAAASILAGRKKVDSSRPPLSATDIGFFFPPPPKG